VGHFEVPEFQAVDLVKVMQTRLPGYLVPRLVKELAGAAHKIRLG
jgi:L-lysine 2,3-aminomutase